MAWERELYPLAVIPHCAVPSPTRTDGLCLHWYACSGYSYECNHSTWAFMTGFFSERDVHKAHPPYSVMMCPGSSVLFVADTSHSVYLLICWWPLVCFHFLAVTNNASMDTRVQVFVWTYVFNSRGHISRNGIAGSDHCFKCLLLKHFTH